MTDAASVDNLLSEWFDWKPVSGRLNSVQRAVRKKELLVAEADSRVVGFIHGVLHEDIIGGGPHPLIFAFYVSGGERRKRVGTTLLDAASCRSPPRSARGVGSPAIHTRREQVV